MRRRKKAKVVWLPCDLNNRLNVAPAAATLDSQPSTIIKLFTGNPLGDVAVAEEIPIVKDFSGLNLAQVANQDASLADIEQSGYRLRRIVGKLHFFVQQNVEDANAATIALVTAGFIIRRTDLLGASLASQIGAAATLINPANLANIQDPWIWRRSWLLANKLGLDPSISVVPGSNADYGGGNLDGAHVDAKTARIVGPEERLFLSVVVEGVNGVSQGAPMAVALIGDLRVLVSMRSQVGNRRNASR